MPSARPKKPAAKAAAAKATTMKKATTKKILTKKAVSVPQTPRQANRDPSEPLPSPSCEQSEPMDIDSNLCAIIDGIHANAAEAQDAIASLCEDYQKDLFNINDKLNSLI